MPKLLVLGFLIFLGSCASPTRQADSPVRIRWSHDPETLDPLALPNQQAIDAANLLHLGLLQLDYQTGMYAPALAVAYPTRRVVADSLLLDYHLRPEATWDNGRPVLATDVAFTLKLMHCPGLPNEAGRVQVDFIENCRLDPRDPRHFTLVCRGQALEFSWASGDFPILPEYAADPTSSLRLYSLPALRQMTTTSAAPTVAALVARYQQANVAHHPEWLPGCGPYRLGGWQTNQSLQFRRKATWWADRLPAAPFVLRANARQLHFLIVPDAAAAMLALRRHDIDIFPQVPARIFQQLRAPADSAGLAFYTTNSNNVVTVGFNTQRPALRSKYTRQALSLLLNPAALRQATQLGQGSLTASLLPPTSPYYNDSLPVVAYNPARASQLLRQAGWQQLADSSWHQPGQAAPLRLAFRYRSDDPTYLLVALQFRAAAARLGIAVELLATDSNLLTQRLRQGDFDVYTGIIKGNPFVFNFAPLLHSRAIGTDNFTRFASPAADLLLARIEAASTPVHKRHLLRQLQAMLRDEAPLAPLFIPPYRLAADRRLRHLTPSSLKPGFAIAAASWVSGPQLAAP